MTHDEIIDWILTMRRQVYEYNIYPKFYWLLTARNG